VVKQSMKMVVNAVLLVLMSGLQNGTFVRAQAPAVKPADGAESTIRLVRPLSRTTLHLEMTAGLSADELDPGTPLSIIVQVTPKKGMHVYAPGQEDYRPILVVLAANPPVPIRETVYPTPIRYMFAPLKQEVLVYSEPFQLTRDVSAETDAERAQIRSRSRVTIKGTLDYQACDDNVCYLPTKIPLEWTVQVKR
jgi:DsbC/DsbD-like thiol-disulfide interchange protein